MRVILTSLCTEIGVFIPIIFLFILLLMISKMYMKIIPTPSRAYVGYITLR